jgi:hypothetical protein
MYDDVALLDVASMHPTSIEQLNLFGDYTPNFVALKDARLAIKYGDYASAREMLDGKLTPYLSDEKDAAALAYALKTVINIVYGLTSAKFDNPFRDHRNIDNIVAKRGALFMIDLKHAVQEQGFIVAHIKTDSIKIPSATDDIITFVKRSGRSTATNSSTRLRTTSSVSSMMLSMLLTSGRRLVDYRRCTVPTSVCVQELFSDEEIEFDDLCETKQVMQGVMYLDYGDKMVHVGRIGRFVPVKNIDNHGGRLLRIKDDKSYAVTGTKDYIWEEADVVKAFPDRYEIDMSYFDRLADEAYKAIDYWGSFRDFAQSRWEIKDA